MVGLLLKVQLLPGYLNVTEYKKAKNTWVNGETPPFFCRLKTGQIFYVMVKTCFICSQVFIILLSRLQATLAED